MTRVSCAMETCEYCVTGVCMLAYIDIGKGVFGPTCLDYKVITDE